MKIVELFGAMLFTLLFTLPASGDSILDESVDPKDGQFDVSEPIEKSTGFIPIPIMISDPAVGYGGGLTLTYFHESKYEEQEEAGEDDSLTLPPSVSFLTGAGTENGSWFAGGGHFGSWKKDTVRYTGGLGYADVNLKFYGIEPDREVPGNNSLDFNIKGFILFQELTFRVKETNFFIGGRYSYFNSSTELKISDALPGIPDIVLDDATAALGLIMNYDSRDNILTPNDGHLAKFHINYYNKAFGGDYEYTKVKASSLSYWPVLGTVVLGVRLEGDFSHGDTPFYDVPYIDMLGIPALRYQGDDVFVAGLEARWDVTQRWSLVAFGGSGWTADDIQDFGDDSAKLAGGGGFRYLIARRLGLRVGFDVAVGPEDTVVYMGIGSTFD